MYREKALQILREHSPYGIALENHCLRLGEFAMALAAQSDVSCDDDLIFAGTYLHDIGLCVKDKQEKSYLRRGVNFVRSQTENWSLSETERTVLDEVLLHNHSLKSIPGISPQAELVRRAVQIEHSLGKIKHGLEKSHVHRVFHKYPRYNFNQVLFSFFKTVLSEDGPLEVLRIFAPQALPSQS